MRARYWMAMALLFCLPGAHAEDSDPPPLELIEMLGDSDAVEADLDIAMSEAEMKVDEKETHPEEVKDDKKPAN